MIRLSSDPLDRHRFPVDEWTLRENEFDARRQGQAETIFTVGNGYLGLRGNLEEGRDGYDHGTFVNGFHETWPIRHAEEAFGFARVGQTIVSVPDAKVIRLYVDDEPFVVSAAELLSYSRVLDMRDGVLLRELEWRTPSGKRVLIRSRRMVSFTDRHVAVIDYEVTLLDADASILISSQILNRQDGVDEYTGRNNNAAPAPDPRNAEALGERVLQPVLRRDGEDRHILGYRTTHSGMTVAVGAEHELTTECEWDRSSQIDDDIAKHVYRVRAREAVPVRLTKVMAYHTSSRVPAREMADRCDRSLDRAREAGGVARLFADQRRWFDDFWARADVVVDGQPEIQQAVRWNLFQVAQATARTDGGGIAAKGVSGTGYGGHYFWDAEIYVLPFLTYTLPNVARNALRFRQGMLDAARERAAEMNQRGALFPWRTINGLESSAYYAAGTAQYHIDADISHALVQYVEATGDWDYLARGAVDILAETARMWEDLGFWRENGGSSFHIHGVTGPDEYTTVVNDNLYTNVMARANLRAAARFCRRLEATDPEAYERMRRRVNLQYGEIEEWSRAAEALHVPFDSRLGIHPQDSQFLEKELWDLEHTPAWQRPLLLHFHPLVIYRFQVLKQADVVLALLLQGDEFTLEEKRADFEYYDPLTTGDSTLSAVVQSVIAAEIGYADLALEYFRSALFVDLADLHRNAAGGIHVASTGGVWSALVFGFGGMRDWRGHYTFDPRLPEDWERLEFRFTLLGSRIRAELRRESIVFTVEEGEGADLWVRGEPVVVRPGAPSVVALEGQGRHLTGVPRTSDLEGARREDGSIIVASVPTVVSDHPDESEETPQLGFV
jgi:alpha,alpha-trehalose phosphorylase